MDNLTFEKIREALDKHNNIGIVVPANPSMDKMAAALSLYLALTDSGKNVSVATPQTPLVEVSNLVGIDRVKTSLGGEGGDLIVSFPYREGEIEKVSYTRDDNFLNIVVKAGELGLNFNERDVKFTRGGQTPELLFVIGAEKISDLGKLFDPANLKDTVIINIDNSAQNQGFGDILMVSNRFSSISETVAELLITLNFRIDQDIAQNLMSGIEDSTHNFQDPATSSLAFEMMGILMRSGAQRQMTGPQRSMPMPQADDFIKQQEERARAELQRMEDIERREGSHAQMQQARPSVMPSTPRRSQSAPQSLPVQDEPEENIQNVQDLDNPPEDWLEPKIYKGSTNF